jgi:tetratricopeptide (TPR) repeat protein
LDDRLVDLWRRWEEVEIKRLLDASKHRLSNDPVAVQHAKIRAQVYQASQLTDLLAKRLGQSDVDRQVFDRLLLDCPDKWLEVFGQLTRILALTYAPAAKLMLENDSSVSPPVEMLQAASGCPYAGYLLQRTATSLSNPGTQRRFESYVYAQYLLDKHSYEQCLQFCNVAIKDLSAEFTPRMHRLKGLALHQLQYYEEALEELERSASLDEQVRAAILDCLDKLQRHEEASKLLQPGSISRLWHLFKAELYGQCQSELRAAGQNVENVNKDLVVLEGLLLWHLHGDRQSCLELWRERHLNFQHNAIVALYTGKHFYAARDVNRALPYLRAAFRSDPGNLDICLALSEALLAFLNGERTTTPDGAREIIRALSGEQNARLQGKRHWQRFLYLGLAHALLDDNVESLRLLHESLKSCPPSQRSSVECQCLRHMAWILHRQRHWEMLHRALLRYRALELERDLDDDPFMHSAWMDVLIAKDKLADASDYLLGRIDHHCHMLLWLHAALRLLEAARLSFNKSVLERVAGTLGDFELSRLTDQDSKFIWLLILSELPRIPKHLIPTTFELHDVSRAWTRLMAQSWTPRLTAAQLALYGGLECQARRQVLTRLVLQQYSKDRQAEVLSEFALLSPEAESSAKQAGPLVDEEDQDGTYWLSKYHESQSEAHLLGALELLTDVPRLLHALRCHHHHRCDDRETHTDSEVLLSALERVLTFSELLAPSDQSWCRQWLARLLEQEGFLREALNICSAQQSAPVHRLQLQLGLEGDARYKDASTTSPSLVVNQVRSLYERGCEVDQEKAWSLLEQVPVHWRQAFLLAVSLQSEAPLENDVDPVGILTSAVQDPTLSTWQCWQFVRLLVHVHPKLSGDLLALFFRDTCQRCSFLQSMRVAQDILSLMDAPSSDDALVHEADNAADMLQEMIRERLQSWQERYDPQSAARGHSARPTASPSKRNRFAYHGSALGQQLFASIKHTIFSPKTSAL